MTQDMDLHDLAKLAREMAMNIKPRSSILAAHRLSEEEFEQIEKIEFYQRAFETSVIECNRPMTLAQQNQLIGHAYVQELLAPLAGRAASGEDPLAQSAEVLKIIHMISGGRGSGEGVAPAPGERFQITINLGADHVERFDKPLAITHGD